MGNKTALCLAATSLFTLATPVPARGEMALDGVNLNAHAYASARGGQIWQEHLIRPGATKMSVYLYELDLGIDDYLVIDNGEVEQIFTAADPAGFWTDPLPGGALTLTLIAAPGGHGRGLTIDRYRADYTPDPTLSTYRLDDLVPIAEAPDFIYQSRGPIARVYVEGIGYCSGFLFNRDLLMTNNHCVDSQALCDRTVVQFNYERDVDGQVTTIDEYGCIELVSSSFAFDYAVLRLPDDPARKWGLLTLADRTPYVGERGVVIEHPGGGKKVAAVPAHCRLLDVTSGNAIDSDFDHQCDTDVGASGAPVMDLNLEVLGLHHLGGAAWLRSTANQAVRMDLIRDDCPVCREEISWE